MAEGGKGTNVGGIYYDVSLDTAELVRGQRQVDRELNKTSGSLVDFGAKLTAVAGAVGVLVAALARLKLAELSDEMRLLQARVEVASGSVEGGAEAFKRLVDVSRRTQTSVAGNIEVFNRLNQSILQMGGNQNDTLQITELLGKAIKVSGASAVEAKNAMVQFGQALGSGKLAGDELRSLMESAPYLMKQLADGIGVPIGALKNLGSEGKLTADVVANALSKSAAKINADFQKFPQTIAGAMQVSQDAAALLALEYDKLSGGSTMLIGASKGLADVLEELARQFAAANDGANSLGRNEAISEWAKDTRTALSYVADVADVVWQTLSVLGRNVAFVFKGIGTEIGGIGAQVAAVLRGDFAGAAAIGDEMKADAERRRKELDAADAATLSRAKTMGERMRQAWAAPQADYSNEGRKPNAISKLKSTPDPEEARKLKAKAEAAQAYYEGLVADNATALAKIDAEERKAMAENARRQAEDKNNGNVYAAARLEILKKYARDRQLLEEKNLQDIADLNIELTTDQEAKVEAIKVEAIRRANAAEKLGTMTTAEAARAITRAEFEAGQQRAAIAEQAAQTRAEANIAATVDELTKIDLIRQEAMRRADAAYKAGAISYAQAEADKVKASVDAQNAIRQQLLSLNPLAQLQQEYEQKLSIVKAYEQQIAQAGVDATAFVESKKTELAYQYQQQRLQLAETEFASQSASNKLLMDSLNSLGQSASQSITGLITGTMTAADAMRNLAGVVLNEAVGALVQIGLQYLKNAILSQTADEAMAAARVAKATAYTAAVTAQVEATTALAAQAAFASTAAIPIVGPELAPAAATAAGIAAQALGAPAIIAAPVAGARRYGGPTSAGSLYRVNETGKPEMFTAANGNQYMLGMSNGNVTPADQVGGKSMPPIVNIYEAPADTTTRTSQNSQGQWVVDVMLKAVAEDMATGGKVARATQSRFNLRA